MNQFRRRRARLAAAVAVMLAGVMSTVALPAAPASADAFPSCAGAGCLPDNFNHWWCYDNSIDLTLLSAIRRAMNTLDTQTNYVSYPEPDFVCNTATDVVWQQNSGISDRGDFWCLDDNSAGRCEQALIRLNPGALTNTTNRRKTACHELGHSVGLTHGAIGTPENEAYTDCMRSGTVDNVSTFWEYDDHHITHANDRR